MAPEPKKALGGLERFQVVVGIILSVSATVIGWKTFQLDESVKESNVQLKNIEQQLAEAKFGFERIRDVYDRTEKYLTSEKQDEKRGRALIVLIGTLPDPMKAALLELFVREATSRSVAATAAETQQGRTPAASDSVRPTSPSSNFIGDTTFRLVPNEYKAEAVEGFSFKDSKGIVWSVPQGFKTDGASVPRSFWSVTGPPLSGELITSSALFDYYSLQKSRPSEEVARMYREALLSSGVSEAKASALYNAVRLFGPRWDSKP